MSYLVNDRVLDLIHEAAEETNTVDGLEAILLVLEKLSGATGLITDNEHHGKVVLFVERKMNLLRVGSVLNE